MIDAQLTIAKRELYFHTKNLHSSKIMIKITRNCDDITKILLFTCAYQQIFIHYIDNVRKLNALMRKMNAQNVLDDT